MLVSTTPQRKRREEASAMQQPQFFTVEQFSKKYPAFTAPSLRWMLFNRDSNGLRTAVVQIGRRVLIDEEAFVAWLREHRSTAA